MIAAAIIALPVALLAGITYRRMRQNRQHFEQMVEALRSVARSK